jgi:hypothetical protein
VLRNISDHADEVDRTIAFAPRGLEDPAVAQATTRSRGLITIDVSAGDRIRGMKITS